MVRDCLTLDALQAKGHIAIIIIVALLIMYKYIPLVSLLSFLFLVKTPHLFDIKFGKDVFVHKGTNGFIQKFHFLLLWGMQSWNCDVSWCALHAF